MEEIEKNKKTLFSKPQDESPVVVSDVIKKRIEEETNVKKDTPKSVSSNDNEPVNIGKLKILINEINSSFSKVESFNNDLKTTIEGVITDIQTLHSRILMLENKMGINYAEMKPEIGQKK